MNFFKYHALGNDYIVLDPKTFAPPLTPANIKLICHRNFGVGSDGILYGPLPSERAGFQLRIFNPDGSEAEKSGNGLRIFCRYLFEQKLVREKHEFLIIFTTPEKAMKSPSRGCLLRCCWDRSFAVHPPQASRRPYHQ